jgi:hypothetical protein
VPSNYTRRFLPVLQIAGKGVGKTGVWMMSQIKVEIGVDDETDKGCNRCDDLCKTQSQIMKTYD